VAAASSQTVQTVKITAFNATSSPSLAGMIKLPASKSQQNQ